jgi:hypothetical protein
MTDRLFISHASEDAAIADKIVAYLEARGVPCWISSRDIPPRAIYADAIVEGMQSCTACAVLVSAASNASKAVKREVELASHEDKAFIPIRIDGSEPASGLAYYLRNAQWLEYKRDGENALARIAARDKSTQTLPTKRFRAPASRRLIVAGVAAVVLSLFALIAYVAITPKQRDAELTRDAAPDAQVVSLNVHFAERSFWLGESANEIALAAQERGHPPVAAAITPPCGDALEQQRTTAVFVALRRGGLQPYQIYATDCSGYPNVVLVALDWERQAANGLQQQFTGQWQKLTGDACINQTFEFGTSADGFYWAVRDTEGLRNQALGSALRVGPQRIQVGSASEASSWAFEVNDDRLMVFDLSGDPDVPICEYAQLPNGH